MTDTTFGPIGAWVNGVSAWSYKSETKIKFGGLTGITIDNPGQGYDAANPPIIELMVVVDLVLRQVLLLTVL